MKLIFDWALSFYEEKNDWHSDEEIISLEIFQKENGFAIAKITIAAQNGAELLNRKYAKIGIQKDCGTELLFSGRLVAFPAGFDSSTMELEFISEPNDYQTKLSEFSQRNFNAYREIDKHTKNKDLILFDDLFFSSRDFKNPTIFLEGNNEIFYWNMKNGDLALSNINRGRRNFDIDGSEIFQNSIKVRMAREPYKVVNLKISAGWIQHEYGIIDLFPMIAQKFEQHLVNSFTNIKSGIENIFSEKKGYRLIQCNIKEINPNTLGFTKLYSTLSPDFFIRESGASIEKKVRFKRFYFDGKLIINWAYKQKRVENVNVVIRNTSSPYGREKNLYIRLNAIQLPKKYPIWKHFTYFGSGDKIQYQDSIFECTSSHISNENFESHRWNFIQKIPDALTNDMSSSFFSTIRGKNAIKYALQKAIALINYSSRYIEIDFCVGAEKFMLTSIDDQITLYDKRFPGGSISGKIIKVRFIGNADQKIIKFTIGCSMADLSKSFEKLNSHMIQVMDDKSRINPADIVRKIEIENTPEEQIAILAKAKAHSSSELKDELKKYATKIKLSLHPLSTTKVITREINLPDFEIEKL
ncbi:MAG: hypothetical protein LBB25_04605 [Holosporaceae bacterium]|jgi:hypothetical protein|nr:hypothetical protein [Holosporaceae bacterium]